MASEIPEQRGVPPTRPFPSQVMHLLELTRLELDEAATVTHQSPANLEKWMTFKVSDAMPPAQWLLLNLYTYCVKNVCWPEPLETYIRDRFPDAFPETIKPARKIRIPQRPPTPSPDEVVDMLRDAQANLEELAYVKKNTVDTWFGPDKKPIPYAVYELAVMTLWARGQYTPGEAMTKYIRDKYYGVFNPKK